MNVITSIAPIVASAATLASSPTLILVLGLLHLGAKAVGRLIPDNRKGVLGAIRKAAKVLAVEPHNRVFDTTSIVGTATLGAPASGIIADVATSFLENRDGVVKLPGGLTLDLKPGTVAAPLQDAVPEIQVGDVAAAHVAADIAENVKSATIARAAADKVGALLSKLKS